MKKSSLLKSVVVIGLSLLLVANLASVVFADDATFGWDDPTITNEAAANTSATNTSTTNTSTNTTNSITTDLTTNTTNITNTSNTSISTGSATTTLNTTSTNESENEVNSLAYTGIENNSFLVVIILIGAMIAGYSLKKVKEYNNI